MISIRVGLGLLVCLSFCMIGDVAVAADAHGAPVEVNTSPLEFKTDLAIWTGIIFLLLMTVLWKVAWGPIIDGLKKREQGIADQIAQAKERNEEAKQLLGQYDEKLAESGEEVRQMIEQARRDADKAGRELIEAARDEANAEKDRGIREIEAATADALKELAEQSATVAVGLAGKIVGAELRNKDHSKLVEQAMAGFADVKSGGNSSA